MARILWKLIGILTDQNQLLLCITLLYQIHNVFDTRDFVEAVIGHYLSQDNINEKYMKQFFLLWHLGRNLSIKLYPNKKDIRTFDR